MKDVINGNFDEPYALEYQSIRESGAAQSAGANAETGRVTSESGETGTGVDRKVSGSAGVLDDLVAQTKYERGTAGLLDAKGNIPSEKLTKTRRGAATTGGILGVIQSVLLGGALVWTTISMILAFFGMGDFGPLSYSRFLVYDFGRHRYRSDGVWLNVFRFNHNQHGVHV